jgi:hypothetical protein
LAGQFKNHLYFCFVGLTDAATRIQACFRGHMSRKVVTAKEIEDLDIQEITKKVFFLRKNQ